MLIKEATILVYDSESVRSSVSFHNVAVDIFVMVLVLPMVLVASMPCDSKMAIVRISTKILEDTIML